jgi:hypothetical protein
LDRKIINSAHRLRLGGRLRRLFQKICSFVLDGAEVVTKSFCVKPEPSTQIENLLVAATSILGAATKDPTERRWIAIYVWSAVFRKDCTHDRR